MSARVELYREVRYEFPNGPSRPDAWRWRFIKNGRIMADSGQGYSRRIDAVHGAATVLGGRYGNNAKVGLRYNEWIDQPQPLASGDPAQWLARWNTIHLVDLTRTAS